MTNIYLVYDKELGRHKYFITEYPDNDYIEKTVTYFCEVSIYGEYIKPGKIEVYLRNGECYIIECWVTFYTSQFGIQVSHDGQFVYVNSDEKGLWCYTYKGELVWKTRYTSVSHIIENDNNTVTCITSTKIIILDEGGKKIKERKIQHYHAEKASKNLIYAAVTENTMALIDCKTLDIIWKSSLKELGLNHSRYAVLYDRYLIIKGEKQYGGLVFIPIELPREIYQRSKYDVTIASKDGFDTYIKSLKSPS